jgi:hypothetical protein
MFPGTQYPNTLSLSCGRVHTVLITSIIVAHNEIKLLEENIKYHLDIGFDRFLVMLHRETKSNIDYLLSVFHDHPIQFFFHDEDNFKQKDCQQRLLNYIQTESRQDQWVFPLDADEFIWLDKELRQYLKALAHQGINYAAIKHFNMLHDLDNGTYYDDPLESIYGYFPYIERSWEMPSSLYKSFTKIHDRMDVFQGGHFFLSQTDWPPVLPATEIKMFHYSNKGTPESLLEKWRALSESRLNQELAVQPVWWEKYEIMAARVKKYEFNRELLIKDWFQVPRTFWGTVISENQIIKDERMRVALNR